MDSRVITARRTPVSLMYTLPKGATNSMVHVVNVMNKVLKEKLNNAHLTFSCEKSTFGQSTIMGMGPLCGTYGRKTSLAKVNAINEMKECKPQTKVRRFLEACAFYRKCFHITLMYLSPWN